MKDRITLLEARLRRTQVALAATGCLTAASMLFGFQQSQPRDIEARSFVLRNDEGKVVGYFGACETGSEFVLYGPEANTALHFHGTEQGGQVQVFRAEDNEAAELLGTEKGGRLTLRGADGQVSHRLPAGD